MYFHASLYMEHLSHRLSRYSDSRTVFLLGMLIYLSIQVGIVVYTDQAREAPCEVDDAYSYILKAARFENGLYRQHAALESIKDQTAENTTDPTISKARSRAVWMIHYQYAPVYSAVLASIDLLVHDWEKSFSIFRYLGSLLIGVGIALWLRHLFGATIAGIALVICSFAIFTDQGLHYIVPGNITLGFFLLAWIVVCSDRKIATPLLFLFIPILCYLHRIGYIYATLLIICSFIHPSSRSWKERILVCSAAGVLLLLCQYLGTFLFSADYLLPAGLGGGGSGGKMGFVKGVRININQLPEIINFSSIYRAKWYLVCFLGISGVYFLADYRKARVIKAGGLIAFILFVSLFHMFPSSPATLFGRLWILAATLTAGAVAGAFYFAAIALIGKFSRDQVSKSSVVISIVILCMGVPVGYHTFHDGIHSIYNTCYHMIGRQRYKLYKSQTEKLGSLINNGDEILYSSEIPLFFYLSNGFLDYKAIFTRLLEPQDTVRYITSNPHLKYVSMINPLVLMKDTFEYNWFTLQKDKPVGFSRTRSNTSDFFSLHIANRNKTPGKITVTDGQHLSTDFIVDSGTSQWFSLSGEFLSAAKFEIFSENTGLTVTGFRTNGGQTTNWPWNTGWSVHTGLSAHGSSKYNVDLDTSIMFAEDQLRTFVLDDNGFTLLARVEGFTSQ